MVNVANLVERLPQHLLPALAEVPCSAAAGAKAELVLVKVLLVLDTVLGQAEVPTASADLMVLLESSSSLE
jgi:hypothetical protein